MAIRPIFVVTTFPELIQETLIDFDWTPGTTVESKQASVESLHLSAIKYIDTYRVLEVSTKSRVRTGVLLSAFNLTVNLKNGRQCSLENVFQSSKVFKLGGPFRDLLWVTPLEAKRDERLKNNGTLIGFKSNGELWDLYPPSLFYDWIYLNALKRRPKLAREVLNYDVFTDIEFNPNKSINCQARSCALFVSLSRAGLLEEMLASKTVFVEKMSNAFELRSNNNIDIQGSLF